MQKKIAISQSNYIPWIGYFDLINYVDVFVFFDEVQFTRRDWRNRNRVMCDDKIKWLSIPLKNKGNYFKSIYEMEIKNQDWKEDHLNKIRSYYQNSKDFKKNFQIIEEIYYKIQSEKLSEINQTIIKEVCKKLGIETKFYNSNEFCNLNNETDPSFRLLNICKENKVDLYVSGPVAKNYLNERLFEKSNIKVEWFKYNETDQNNKIELSENLSIIHSLINYGLDKSKFLKYVS